MLVAKAIYGDGFLHALFGMRALRRLGNVSYSFYLLHGLMIIVVCDYLGPRLGTFPEILKFLVLLVIALAASSAVASVSYALFEKPYFALKARLRDSASRSFEVPPSGRSIRIGRQQLYRRR
jgi:exopolysaccharide production protein ExoZ